MPTVGGIWDTLQAGGLGVSLLRKYQAVDGAETSIERLKAFEELIEAIAENTENAHIDTMAALVKHAKSSPECQEKLKRSIDLQFAKK